MECEEVNERFQWEARRVAAAFEVTQWMAPLSLAARTLTSMDRVVFCTYDDTCSRLISLRVRLSLPDETWLFEYEPRWKFYPGIGKTPELMARGLYRLGFEDEGVFAQLPVLSAHEKMELRLSLPREFWPKQWLDEKEERS